MKPTPLKQRATVAKNIISRLLILSFVRCLFPLSDLPCSVSEISMRESKMIPRCVGF